jgi:hypothetical protein
MPLSLFECSRPHGLPTGLRTPLWLAALLLAGSLLGTSSAQAQRQASGTATVSGFVTDAANGQPLAGTNVIVQQVDDPSVQRGAATDRDGLYLIPRLPPGRYALRASFIGYASFVDTLSLDAGETRSIYIRLAPQEAALEEVVVESEREGAADLTAGQQTIQPAEIERIPTPDVGGDLTTYLSTLPSVVTTADRGGQLFIRGGEPSQNLVLLDGMTLYQPFHLLGFYSAFPSEIINHTDLYAGGFGAQYGGRLSSVIDVSARAGNKNAVAGGATLSPFMSSVHLEGPILPGRISFLASGRRSMLEQGIDRFLDQSLPFVFGDGFAKVHAIPTSNSRLSVSALRTYDRGTLAPSNSDAASTQQVRWRNWATGGRYLAMPRLLPVVADLHLAFSGLHTEIGPPGAPDRVSRVQTTRIALDATFPGYRTTMKAGLLGNFTRFTNDLGGLYQNVETGEDKTLDHFALYFEPEFNITSQLRARAGLRLQFLQSRFEPFPTPRVRVVWEGETYQVSAAAGLYYQEVLGLTDRRDAANVFTVWTHIPKKLEERPDDVRLGRTPRALHGILGYEARLNASMKLSVEGFYKDLADLFVAEWTAFPRLTTRLQPAEGRSFGGEMRLEARHGPFYGYIGYGYSNTVYEAQQADIDLWYGTETLRFRPPHDRRHQLSALGSVEFAGFGLSVRWQFGSGQPFSRVVGFDGFALIDEVEDVVNVPGSRRVIYGPPYDGTLPTYHRLDASIERSFALSSNVTLATQASVVNAYDRPNIFYLDTFTLQRVNQLPLTPSLGLALRYR